MNNVFEEVKQRADILRVCEMLGLKLNRSHMCCCPFHNEKTPSFSVHQEKGIFKCFGCGETGDEISLVSKIYNINPLDAVKLINQNLGLGIEFGNNSKLNKLQANRYEQKKKIKEEFEKWQNKTMQILCDYYQLLSDWGKKENWESDKYLEFCNNIDYIDDLIDNTFINGTDEDKIWYWKNKRNEVSKIESRIRFSRTLNK